MAKVNFEGMCTKPHVVIKNSKMTLSNGTLELLGPDAETLLARKKKGFNPEWIPVKDRVVSKPRANNVSGKDLITLVRRSIRRPNPSKHAKTGLASLFFCPYTDCKEKGSSEAFAAINVARKLTSSIELSE